MWPVTLFQTIVNAIAKVGRGVAILIALLVWLNGIIEKCIAELFEAWLAAFDLLMTDGLTGGGSAGPVSLAAVEYIGYINAFLPVSEFVGLMSLYLTAWGTVIGIRWIKSLVPALSN